MLFIGFACLLLVFLMREDLEAAFFIAAMFGVLMLTQSILLGSIYLVLLLIVSALVKSDLDERKFRRDNARAMDANRGRDKHG